MKIRKTHVKYIVLFAFFMMIVIGTSGTVKNIGSEFGSIKTRFPVGSVFINNVDDVKLKQKWNDEKCFIERLSFLQIKEIIIKDSYDKSNKLSSISRYISSEEEDIEGFVVRYRPFSTEKIFREGACAPDSILFISMNEIDALEKMMPESKDFENHHRLISEAISIVRGKEKRYFNLGFKEIKGVNYVYPIGKLYTIKNNVIFRPYDYKEQCYLFGSDAPSYLKNRFSRGEGERLFKIWKEDNGRFLLSFQRKSNFDYYIENNFGPLFCKNKTAFWWPDSFIEK